MPPKATYIRNHSRRNREGALAVFVCIALCALCWFLFYVSGRSLASQALAWLSVLCLICAIRAWLRPDAWTIDISSGALRWRSPNWPYETSTIMLAEIAAVWTTRGNPDAVELRLNTGDIIRVPPKCTGTDPYALVHALSGLGIGDPRERH